MKGLLVKDFYMAAKYCKAFLIVFFIFFALSLLGDDNDVFFIVYPTMIAGIIPMTLLSYDERDKWSQYSATLPYRRSQLVSSKYLIGLLLGAPVYIMSITVSAVRMSLYCIFSLEAFLAMAAILLVLSVMGPTLLLPFVFRFGAEKGRIAFYVMVGMLCAIGTLLAGMGFQAAWPGESLWMPGLIAGIAGLLYAFSWRLSIHCYRNRDL